MGVSLLSAWQRSKESRVYMYVCVYVDKVYLC